MVLSTKDKKTFESKIKVLNIIWFVFLTFIFILGIWGVSILPMNEVPSDTGFFIKKISPFVVGVLAIGSYLVRLYFLAPHRLKSYLPKNSDTTKAVKIPKGIINAYYKAYVISWSLAFLICVFGVVSLFYGPRATLFLVYIFSSLVLFLWGKPKIDREEQKLADLLT